MELVWVLVEPRRPENVGAAARALKTQGFYTMRLVSPCDHLAPEAHWLAHGAQELLQGAQVFETLEQALADVDLVLGTTAKLRHGFSQLYTPAALGQALAEKQGSVARVALLFGPEDTGLSGEVLDRCHLLTGVPLAQPFPSLNLAQAVMVYAHALSAATAAERAAVPMSAAEAQWAALVGRIDGLLDQLQVEPAVRQWARERLPLLSGRDVRLMHSLMSRLDKHISSGNRDE